MKTLPKIQQFMAQNTAIFRRKAEELVKKGYVRLNGELAKPGERVVPQDDLVEYTLNGTTWSKVKYDGDMLVKNYTDLTIASGHTMTVDQNCRGMLIYCSQRRWQWKVMGMKAMLQATA